MRMTLTLQVNGCMVYYIPQPVLERREFLLKKKNGAWFWSVSLQIVVPQIDLSRSTDSSFEIGLGLDLFCWFDS